MNNTVLTNGFRFVLLAMIQIFILRGISVGGWYWSYFQIIIYPLFIFLLPLRTNRALVLLLAFALGLLIDVFYDTLGFHASASVFTAYMRFWVLQWLAPKGGYNENLSPTKRAMSTGWFMSYASILLFCHLFFYFSVEAFTLVYIVDILLRTIASFVISFTIIIIIQFIFNPRE